MLGNTPQNKSSVKKNDPPYRMEKITNADKVYGLSLIWKETSQHIDGYNPEYAKRWNRAYHKYLNNTLQALTLFTYYRNLQEFAALLHDGQTRVLFPEFLRKLMTCPPLQLVDIQKKAIVSNVAKEWERKIPIGSEITAIAGIPVTEYLEKYIIPYISSSTEQYLWHTAIEGNRDTGIGLLRGPANSYFRLSFTTPSGEKREIRITRLRDGDHVNWVRATPKAQLKWLDNRIAYLNYSTLVAYSGHPSQNNLQTKLSQANGIILDLRMRRQDCENVKSGFLNQLLSMTSSIPMTVLTDVFTSGSAEDYIITARKKRKINVIGEPTSSDRGATRKIQLPGDAYAFVKTSKRSASQKSILPDISVSLQHIDVIKGNDPVLEKALSSF